MTSHARSLSEHLRTHVVPRMAGAGFAFDGSRTFRRVPAGTGRVQIVNFQLGQRFMEGRFTVNLGVYDPATSPSPLDPQKALEHHCAPDLRQRLGVLLPSRFGALARVPGVGVLFRPRDRWWPVSSAGVKRATDATVTHGLPWLQRRLSS